MSAPPTTGYLCMTVSPDEVVRVGENVYVRAQRKGSQVLLAIMAPKDVKCLRMKVERKDDEPPRG